MTKNFKETWQNKAEKFGGVTLRKSLPDLLQNYTNRIRNYGWKVEVTEVELPESSGSFGQDTTYRGQLVVRYRKLGYGQGNEIIDQTVELIWLQSIVTSSQKQLATEDLNDSFTDRYYYWFDKKNLFTQADGATQKILYQEAGGNPDSEVWPITPEQLKKHYPRYLNSKILIDGWAKSFDQSKSGESAELSKQEVEQMERIAATINSSLIRALHTNQQPVVVTAGNSAGIQKLISPVLEAANCRLLFALPESKDPKKYIEPSKTLVLQAPPQKNQPSQWGDELVGETGIASTEFNVRLVLLIGGGENLKKQLPIYLDNVLTAKQKNKMYVIAAIQGVGGVSSKNQLFVELEKYARTEKYRSLFQGKLNEEYLPDWLQLIDSNNESQAADQIDNLIFRTFWSDQF